MELRRITGCILGVIAAFVVMMAWELVANYVFPPPPQWGGDDRAVAMQAPAGALVTLLLGYVVGVMVGALVAVRFVREGSWPAWVVAGVMIVGAVGMLVQMPHPLWFMVLAPLLMAGAGWLTGVVAGPGNRALIAGDAAP